MEVEGAEHGRAMTPEEVLDELRDEVRESETTYETHEPHEHTPCATEDGKKKDSVLDADAVVSRPPFVKAWLTHSLSLSLSHVSSSGEGGARGGEARVRQRGGRGLRLTAGD